MTMAESEKFMDIPVHVVEGMPDGSIWLVSPPDPGDLDPLAAFARRSVRIDNIASADPVNTCSCGGPDRVSVYCRLHRDPKLNECEDRDCPGCYACWGEFWDPDREDQP